MEQPIGVTPESQQANRSYTLAPTPRTAWFGRVTPQPPLLPRKMGQLREKGGKDSTIETIREVEVAVWN